MKKTLFIAVFLGLMIFPNYGKAQEVTLTPESRAVLIAEIQAKIQELMILLIQALQAELTKQITATAEAQSTASKAQNEAMAIVSGKVDTVILNTTPLPVGVVAVEAKPLIAISSGNCQLVASITQSDDYKYGHIQINPGKWDSSGWAWEKKYGIPSMKISATGNYPYLAKLYKGGGMSASGEYDGELVAQGSGDVNVACE